ncbi:MAG: tripartite tricarboxylate transporter TctB family protein [Pyramidobacter sp.]|nr:tripartite tricarboxylate transporter TctB family protein [Pyramidobacter sp.]MBQ9422551.1 tripartite tricarboxylate transporter TctB family protein [Pyramidobacter sp.]
MKFGKQQNLSLLYILFGMALFAMTSQIKYRFAVATEDVGPRFFPYCCAAGFVLCGLGKFVSSLGKGSGKPFIGSLSGWGRMAVILLVLLLYVYGLKYIGYLASGFLLMTALVLMLGLDRRPPLWKAMVFSAVVTLSTYLFFENAVHVLLPSGVWMKPLLRALR